MERGEADGTGRCSGGVSHKIDGPGRKAEGRARKGGARLGRQAVGQQRLPICAGSKVPVSLPEPGLRVWKLIVRN